MTESNQGTVASPDEAGKRMPPRILVGTAEGVTLFDMDSELICVKQMPLPGVVIFVHGVNSEGEWYTAAEEGLCKGLNRRLGRLDGQLAYTGVKAGQMAPVSYIESLTPDGYVNPKMWAETYIKPDPSFSPVIHFRWGYKANKQDLKDYGANLFLNEHNYWGGGPFANGCSSLADLWSPGLDDRIFGWLTVQALNSTPRLIYQTPPRAYMVMAALRLAKLIKSIREKQADVPITVVCHSQGNMIGLAAAFLGDRMSEVTDPWGKAGSCVADAYVLANAPYSLVEKLGMENWAQRTVRDADGNRGRATFNARADTLKAFFEILRKRAALEPDARELDEDMGNKRPSAKGKPYSAGDDRTSHGLNGHTLGRVTLYCCPHDQVISATTVQGIGWRGMSAEEIERTGGHGVFTQRVFASGWLVGKDPADSPTYRYWEDDWRATVNRSKGFWYPPSPSAEFGLYRALNANENPLAALGTLATAPLLYFARLIAKPRINADPPENWTIPVTAPKLDEPFEPEAMRYGRVSEIVVDGLKSRFNESYDPPSAARNAQKREGDKDADDPYDTFSSRKPEMHAQGTQESEAAQRYEDHALMRQEARRNERHGRTKGWVNDDGKVAGEDNLAKATIEYKAWRNGQIGKILKEGSKNNPTNHSTILTNPMHARKALAYDIAIGLCYLSEDDWWALRIEADWRFGNGLSDTNPAKMYWEYFDMGTKNGVPLHDWAHNDPEAVKPAEIDDQREGDLFLSAGGVV
ncbi:T6SS effector phospholipase Tle3 domain-containing protein [Trinickia symbiotica]